MAHVSIETVVDETARDARTDWDEGDLIYISGVGFMFYGDDDAWHVLAEVEAGP